ncbi:hypothetical protein KCP77_20470 [Salmonella enterica subsp. enterica]|nr:hypothetical protein KCP77_20470 [Salmonella enterica subsp. enterica]
MKISAPPSQHGEYQRRIWHTFTGPQPTDWGRRRRFQRRVRQRDSGHLFYDRLCAIQRCAVGESWAMPTRYGSCAGTNRSATPMEAKPSAPASMSTITRSPAAHGPDGRR